MQDDVLLHGHAPMRDTGLLRVAFCFMRIKNMQLKSNDQ
jgi:hypothetical protein